MRKGIIIYTMCVVLTGIASAAPLVVTGPVINSTNNHEYYLLENSTWTEAESKAVDMGGHLTAINDAVENVWVWDTFGSLIEKRGLWIGYTDVGDEGNFRWTNGDPTTFTSWGDVEPNNEFGIENYVTLIDGIWNDLPDITVESSNFVLHGVVEIVPEPATLSLLALGSLVTFYRRKYY